MDLSIIIVSWNVREHLQRCLESIARHTRDVSLEVFVVDNASRDGTREFLKNQESRIKNQGLYSFFVILNSQNRGFAAANNQAIRKARGKYILLLNPDTELESITPPKLLNPLSLPLCKGEKVGVPVMLQFMESHPRCGILGPKLLNSDGTLQPSVRRFPRAFDPLLFSLGMARQYLARDFDYTKAQQVDQVMGAAFLIRRSMLDAIGMFDERFFLWFEEVDYCKRAKHAGWEVWYTPDASVLHHGGESFAQVMTTRKQWIYSKSLLQYFWKHGQYAAFIFNALLVPVRLFFSIIIEIASRLRRDFGGQALRLQ